ncbi:MAG: 6,7-dimethyl-8-ribityllumazine synthase [Acidobacteria bacterium]|nr:6,7-dimethyl-8-ribityllumazine synthase [Acidobacteriota bacterium]
MDYKTHEGHLDAKGLKFAIVVARFNNFITDRLLAGALDALDRHGAPKSAIEIVRVPGSWEMPAVARALAEKRQFDGIICLGCVVRGETAHFDYVAGEAAGGLGQVAASTGVPVAFGVLTTNTVEQAVDRAGAKAGNKGFDAAVTAIEMANLMKKLKA